MALASNIVRRGATYYIRVAVPSDLQPSLGKRELWKSLRTKEQREARRRGAEALALVHQDWDDWRKRIELGADELHRAAVTLYQNELALDDARRASLPSASEIEHEQTKAQAAIERTLKDVPEADRGLTMLNEALGFLVKRDAAADDAHNRAVLLAKLREDVAKGEHGLVRWAANEAIERDQLRIKADLPNLPGFKTLSQVLTRSWIEALERMSERDRGDFTGKPADPVMTAPDGSKAPPIAKPGETVAELFEQYVAENPRGNTPDTLRQTRDVMNWFIGHVGKRFPAAAIDKKIVRDWKGLLLKFPVKAAEIGEFQGLTMTRIVERNATLDRSRPAISPKTINRYLSALGAYCHWLMNHGHIDQNPVEGLYLHIDRDASRDRTYSTDQLNQVFRSPLFAGWLSDEKPHQPGNFVIRDHRYWLPLMSLFSGARLGELAQLDTADVRQQGGQWLLHIVRGEGKRTKTKGSQRVVPIHSELIRLGFLDYHKKRVEAGDAKLFPTVTANSRGQVAADFSREWSRYLARVGVKVDATLNFHSFRHTFIDALRRAGYRDEEFDFLIGHTGGTTTDIYGVLPQGTLSQRAALVDAVTYPGLDLGHLMNARL